MGSLNAAGWLLCVGAGGDVNELWDFGEELRGRLGDRIAGGPPGLHGFTREERAAGMGARYCYHPTGESHVEFRADELRDALLAGIGYLVRLMPEDEMWRRD
jgi:hypothetical protein